MTGMLGLFQKSRSPWVQGLIVGAGLEPLYGDMEFWSDRQTRGTGVI